MRSSKLGRRKNGIGATTLCFSILLLLASPVGLYASGPCYAWTRTMGDTGDDGALGVAVDSDLSVVVTGWFQGTVDFDPTPGEDWRTSNGGYDTFMTKLSPEGAYLWTRTFGGSSDDNPMGGVAIDSLGRIVIAGAFGLEGLSAGYTVDFDPTAGEDWHSANGGRDIFVTRLYADGTYDRTWTIGGSGRDMGVATTLDPWDSILVAGEYSGTVEFNTTGSGPSDQHTAFGGRDIFVTKVYADGSYGWARTMGGPDGTDTGTAICADSDGAIVIAGGFWGQTVDFDPTVGEDWHTTHGTGLDIFVTRLYADGSYHWTRTMGSDTMPWSESANGVGLDPLGNVVVTGGFGGTVEFNTTGSGPSDIYTSNGQTDIFVTWLSQSGAYVRTYTTGGANGDYGYGVTVDGNANVYVIGDYFKDTVDFDPTAGEDWRTAAGLNDVFMTRFNVDGSYGWTRTVGGEYGDGVSSAHAQIEIDSRGALVAAGRFGQFSPPGYQVDFDSSGAGDVHTGNGGFDAFVTKLDCASADEQDCNSNGVIDCCDIAGGTSPDANSNGVPDECDIPCAPLAARSCKEHAGSRFCLDTDDGDDPEPRQGGITEVEIDLDTAAGFWGGVSVDCTTPWSGSVNTAVDQNTVTLTFAPALPDKAACTITLDCGAAVCVRGLAGDADLDGVVTVVDNAATKLRFGMTVAATTARFDFNRDADISPVDNSQRKLRFGNYAPACP